MTVPVDKLTTPQKPQETMSAAEFFNQDDDALARAMGFAEEEPKSTPAAPGEPEAVSAPPVAEKEVAVSEEPPVAEETPKEEPPAKAPPTPGEEVQLPGLGREPITEFSVRDREGEVEIPDLTIHFKALGKDREMALDHVVRMAQYGFSNRDREEQVIASRKFVAEVQQANQSLQAQLDEYKQYFHRIMSDPAFTEEARDLYAKENAPEVRVQRLESELQNERARQAEFRENLLVQEFVTSQLVPITQQLLTDNSLVTQTELIGRWTELTAPLLVNGRVPYHQLAEVQRVMRDELAPWVQARQLERQSVRKQVDAQQAKAQSQAALAKRQVARVLSPTGAVAPGREEEKPVKYKSADAWLKAEFGDPSEE